ncbi:FHA domain-containing protein [Chelatococcus sp. GCM10030263]|uniref:SctD/MshK family protein n=1 Tax=Chelatococcus sp. GCM10030263 TaxID=3273387 RepID=UPI0036082F83
MLDVTGGLHRDTNVGLDGTVWRIGSAPDDDVVLLDRGVEPHHALLRRDGAAFEIEAVGGEVIVAGTTRIAPGFAGRFRTPVTFTLAGAELRLRDTKARPRTMQIAVTTLAVAALVLAARLVPWNGVHDRTGGSVEEAGPATASDQAARRDVAGAPEPDRIEAALTALHSRLAAAGLTSLHARAEAGRLVVAGTLTTRQSAQWEEIDRWFDATFAGTPPLVAEFEAAEVEKPAVVLKAVWNGARSFIVTADGVTYFQGDRLPEGWTIASIEPGRVVLTRAGESVTLTY